MPRGLCAGILALLAVLVGAGVSAVRETKLYDTLGVAPDASDATIKKAYKRMALQYHPDRAKGDKKKAETKFQEVAHAYETLSDPEKRQVYDRYGEEGLKKAAGGQDPGGFNGFPGGGGGGGHRFTFQTGGGSGPDPFKVFNTFFGGGGGGFPGGGHQQHQRQQERPQPAKIDYSGSQVIAMDKNDWHDMERDKSIWIIEFYAPWCGHCQKLAPEWKKAAESLKGVVKVGAVNCDNEDLESICKDAGVSGYPTIKWFQKGKDQGAYRGNRKGAEIVAWGLELLPNLVAQITSKAELDDVMGRCSGRGKSRASWSLCVLLFTEKKDTSPMLKSLAMQFEGDAVIAEVRGPEATRMASSFAHNGTAFPFILAVCNGDASSATQHKGALKHEPIKRFLDGYRGGRKCASSVKLDLNTDFSKLRVSQLKEILRTAGEGCTGCVEKDDFVKAVKLLISSNAA